MSKEDLEKQIELLVKDDESNQQTIINQRQEIERLNNIIKEVREYIESYMPNYDFDKTNLIKLLEILDKGSDKE